MLEIINLCKKFGQFSAVDQINIKINAGDLYGFLGPNGAGKTTTIKMIVGLYNITSGKIKVNQMDSVLDSLEVKREIGYIPDQPYLYDRLTGQEYLAFCAGLYDLDKKIVKSKIEEMVELFKIEEWFYKRIEEYSQGMKQRITFASAFLHDPSLLIIDEPMIGLDPQSAHIVKSILKQSAANGKTIFMSTHSLNVVEEICNRVGIINKGVMIFDDDISKLHVMKTEMQNNFEELFIELTS
ncbi:MAG: ABC transporter ATP-binding protein [Bacteroidetes bacterium]|nr:ABC transporter ATP-binding protein [Bacteroidota bacterium]